MTGFHSRPALCEKSRMITNSRLSSSSASNNVRLLCERCERPSRACLCAYITPIVPKAEVLILQHPLERHHPKGSARLLQLCLSGSILLTAETFEQELLSEHLHGASPRRPILLYPDAQGLPPAPVLQPEEMPAENLKLVILDGTWRKSRKILHLNPVLQTLPRLSLNDVPSSRYQIRRARHESQLSTLEAACHALALLEQDEMKYRPLLEAFDRFISMQRLWFKS